MIFAATFIAAVAQAAQPTPPADVAETIVVLGQKLDTWKGDIKVRKGIATCKVTSSTGDAELDQVRCNAMRYCAAQIDSQVQALAEENLGRKELNQRISLLANAGMTKCAEDYEDATLTRMAWERAGS